MTDTLEPPYAAYEQEPCNCRGYRCIRCAPIHPNYVQVACDCGPGHLCRYCARWLPPSLLQLSDAVATVRSVFAEVAS